MQKQLISCRFHCSRSRILLLLYAQTLTYCCITSIETPTIDVIVHIFVYFDIIYRISYCKPTETILNLRNAAFWCGSVRVVRGKKPEYSLLCAENEDWLSGGQRLRVLRLRAGLTIRESANMVGIFRHALMNYEHGNTKVKTAVFEELKCLYQTLLSSRK
ncbi:MAG: helix-turn-helix transcriptional regulator [Oscillospiraceae bacterium]